MRNLTEQIPKKKMNQKRVVAGAIGLLCVAALLSGCGARTNAPAEETKTAEEMQAQADALAKDPETAWNELKSLMDQLDAFVVVRDGLGLLDDDRLAAFHAQASFWLERAADILEGRRGNGKVVRT